MKNATEANKASQKAGAAGAASTENATMKHTFNKSNWSGEQATINARKEAKAAKEAMKYDAAVERLEPFRNAYARLNAEGRRQLIAEVLRYVTGGRS